MSRNWCFSLFDSFLECYHRDPLYSHDTDRETETHNHSLTCAGLPGHG